MELEERQILIACIRMEVKLLTESRSALIFRYNEEKERLDEMVESKTERLMDLIAGDD